MQPGVSPQVGGGTRRERTLGALVLLGVVVDRHMPKINVTCRSTLDIYIFLRITAVPLRRYLLWTGKKFPSLPSTLPDLNVIETIITSGMQFVEM